MHQKAFQNLLCFTIFGSLPVKALLCSIKMPYSINSLILLHFWKDILPTEECTMAYFRIKKNQTEMQFQLSCRLIQNEAKLKHRFYCQHTEK